MLPYRLVNPNRLYQIWADLLMFDDFAHYIESAILNFERLVLKFERVVRIYTDLSNTLSIIMAAMFVGLLEIMASATLHSRKILNGSTLSRKFSEFLHNGGR